MKLCQNIICTVVKQDMHQHGDDAEHLGGRKGCCKHVPATLATFCSGHTDNSLLTPAMATSQLAGHNHSDLGKLQLLQHSDINQCRSRCSCHTIVQHATQQLQQQVVAW